MRITMPDHFALLEEPMTPEQLGQTARRLVDDLTTSVMLEYGTGFVDAYADVARSFPCLTRAALPPAG